MSEGNSIRAAVVAEARSWLGTPFHHQGRVKAAGVDCAMP
jgi:cell wall-associated NlpC family hydrolase